MWCGGPAAGMLPPSFLPVWQSHLLIQQCFRTYILFSFFHFSKHHHYPKTLFGFVLFRSAILSMVGFCMLFIKDKKGHGDFALQAIKEDIQKVQILSTN